jgi:hypothetical protein
MGHPGGMGHPAHVPNHMMTPEMHQQHMLQQGFNQMMMMNQMLIMEQEARRGARRSGAGAARQPSMGAKRPGNSGHQSLGANAADSAMSQGRPPGGQSSQLRSSGGQQAGQKSAPGAQTRGALAHSIESRRSNTQASRESRKHNLAASHEAKKKEVAKVHAAGPATAVAAKRFPLGPDQTFVEFLRMANTKLQTTDHDYAGHRSRAMNHVGTAIGHLGGGAGLAMNAARTAGLSQEQSDQMLREAMDQLITVKEMLENRTDRVAQHQRALASVGAAMSEIRIALNIR